VQCQSSGLPAAKRGAAGDLRYQHTQHKRTLSRSRARTRMHARAPVRTCLEGTDKSVPVTSGGKFGAGEEQKEHQLCVYK